MNERRDANSAALVRLDPDLTVTRILGDMMVSNGLAFSPDGRTMYHADTPTHVVRAYDYDAATGLPSHPRVLARWSGETERPDGAVDVEGYWTAFYAADACCASRLPARRCRTSASRRCARRCARSADRSARPCT
jgi:sugar lactone lactonase YvrE